MIGFLGDRPVFARAPPPGHDAEAETLKLPAEAGVKSVGERVGVRTLRGCCAAAARCRTGLLLTAYCSLQYRSAGSGSGSALTSFRKCRGEAWLTPRRTTVLPCPCPPSPARLASSLVWLGLSRAEVAYEFEVYYVTAYTFVAVERFLDK